MSDDDFEDEFHSGPYCIHWSDPSECEEVCVCGHQCREHLWESRNKCDCEKFREQTQ